MARPSLSEAFRELRESVAHGHTCVMIASFTVSYRGRAASELGEGQRLLVLKQDGSILVHRPTGYEPVNWQPSGSHLFVKLADGELILRAVRPRPREEVVVRIARVDVLVHGKLRDDAHFELRGAEHDVRDALARNPWILEEGLKLAAVERRVASGFIDLVFVDREGRMLAVEVKRGVAGAEAVAQLKRYVHELERELGARVRGMLVAEGFARGVRALLAREGLEYRKIDASKLRAALRGGPIERWLP